MPFIGVSASLFAERVVRFVSGGETGAYLGASGVFAAAEWVALGVLGGSSSKVPMSSTSVTASSSSSVISWVAFWVGKSSLGFTVLRLRGRLS